MVLQFYCNSIIDLPGKFAISSREVSAIFMWFGTMV